MVCRGGGFLERNIKARGNCWTTTGLLNGNNFFICFQPSAIYATAHNSRGQWVTQPQQSQNYMMPFASQDTRSAFELFDIILVEGTLQTSFQVDNSSNLTHKQDQNRDTTCFVIWSYSETWSQFLWAFWHFRFSRDVLAARVMPWWTERRLPPWQRAQCPSATKSRMPKTRRSSSCVSPWSSSL